MREKEPILQSESQWSEESLIDADFNSMHTSTERSGGFHSFNQSANKSTVQHLAPHRMLCGVVLFTNLAEATRLGESR
jgi:hypothetical protein